MGDGHEIGHINDYRPPKPTRGKYRQARNDIEFAIGGLKTTRELIEKAKEAKSPQAIEMFKRVEVEHLANIGRAYLILKGAGQ